MDNHKHPSFSDNTTKLFYSLHIRQFVATDSDDFGENKKIKIFFFASDLGAVNCLIGIG